MNLPGSLLLVLCLLGCIRPATAEAPKNDPRHDGLRIAGEAMHADDMDLLGLQFNDVVAEPLLQNRILTFNNLAARFYNGRVEGRVAVTLYNGTVEMDLHLKNVQLGLFMQRFVGTDGYAGTINGRIQLTIDSGDWKRASGRGNIRVNDGRIIQAPMLAALLLGRPGAKTGKDRGTARFTIDKGSVQFQHCVFDNDSFFVTMKGMIGNAGELNLKVTPYPKMDHFGSIPAIGLPVKVFLREFTGHAARFRIQGPISEPQFSADPFS